MKTKSLLLGFLLIIVLAIISVYIFNFDKEIYEICSPIIFGIIGGIILVLTTAYYIPTVWIFKNRFWFYGILFGFALYIFSTLINLTESWSFEITDIAIKLLIALFTGIIVFSTSQFWIYNSARKNTLLALKTNEKEIIADVAWLVIGKQKSRGRIILTNNRLVFIKNNIEKNNIEFDITNISSELEVTSRFGIPNGIILPSLKTEILVIFPFFWKKEIERVVLEATSIS